jgi:hypothetical protein
MAVQNRACVSNQFLERNNKYGALKNFEDGEIYLTIFETDIVKINMSLR